MALAMIGRLEQLESSHGIIERCDSFGISGKLNSCSKSGIIFIKEKVVTGGYSVIIVFMGGKFRHHHPQRKPEMMLNAHL